MTAETYMRKKGYGKHVKVEGQKITGIDIPFMDMVTLFVKASIAAVPAGIIVVCFWVAVVAFSGSFFKALA